MTSGNLKANMNAIIMGSSKGIGKAFLRSAINLEYKCEELNSSNLNTLCEESINEFIAHNKDKKYDLFVFNTGGLAPVNIDKKINSFKKDFKSAFQSYFWSFYNLISNLEFTKEAKIIYISSHVVQNIEPRLMASSVARSSSEKLLENLSGLKDFFYRTCISIRFGPVMTDRLINLMQSSGTTEEELSLKLGVNKVPNPDDVYNLANLLLSSSSLFGSGTYSFDSGIKLLKSIKSL